MSSSRTVRRRRTSNSRQAGQAQEATGSEHFEASFSTKAKAFVETLHTVCMNADSTASRSPARVAQEAPSFEHLEALAPLGVLLVRLALVARRRQHLARVADAVGVELLLHPLQQREAGGAVVTADPRHVLVADAVVVREVALVAQHRLRRGALDLEERCQVAVVELHAGVGEVEAAPVLVLVGRVAPDPPLLALRLPNIANGLLHGAPQTHALAVERRGLENVGPIAVAEGEVAHVRQVVLLLLPVVAGARADAEGVGGVEDLGHAGALVGDVVRRALEADDAQAHLVEVEALDELDVLLDALAREVLDLRRVRLEREAHPRLVVVVEAHAHGGEVLLDDLVERGVALLEGREEPALVVADRGHGLDLHGGLRDDAEDALAADEEARHVGPALARRERRLDDALGRRHLHRQHHVLDVAVLVAVRARAARGDPAAERRVDVAVGVVPEHEAVAAELLVEVRAEHAALERGDARLLVDAQHLAHAAHVDGDDHPARLERRGLDAAGDVRAAAEGNEHDVVLVGKRHKLHAVVVRLGHGDGVRGAGDVATAHAPEVTVVLADDVDKAALAVLVQLFAAELAAEGADERIVDDGRLQLLQGLLEGDRRGRGQLHALAAGAAGDLLGDEVGQAADLLPRRVDHHERVVGVEDHGAPPRAPAVPLDAAVVVALLSGVLVTRHPQ
eukprot:CAMPEP_0174829732 /NCGR_PEP_ID=MMETSP1114-20130205/2107_1 /TAXON_ID=312471 /ORGANISM="Neobodo designis, Strain CCAP 1951/1" /LENGTH=679 /DNA_ID=CAMNT_0016063495 /DNA_START=55 /DNA_END=2095 /DNA_ORIENTATION=-